MLPYFKKDPQSNYAQALTELSLFITEIEQYIERDKSLASQECFNKLKNFKKAYENLFKATGDDQKKIELNQSFNQIIRNFYEYIPLELFEQKGNIFNALVTKKAIVNFIEMAHQDMVQMVDTHKVQDTSPQISQAAIQKLKDYLLEEVDRSVDLLELKEIKGDLESFVTSHYLHQAQVQDIFDAINLKASQLSITDFAQRVGNFNPQKYETPVQVQAALKELISHLKDIPIADNLSEYDKDQYNHAFENLFFHIENELNTINTSVRDFIRNGNQGNLDELSKIEELRESISQSSNELLKINNQILTGSDLLQIRVNKLKANLDCYKDLAIKFKFNQTALSTKEDLLILFNQYSSTVEKYLNLALEEERQSGEPLAIDVELFKTIAGVIEDAVRNYVQQITPGLAPSIIDNGYEESVLSCISFDIFIESSIRKILGQNLHINMLSMARERKDESIDTILASFTTIGQIAGVLKEILGNPDNLPQLSGGKSSININQEHYIQGALKFFDIKTESKTELENRYRELRTKEDFLEKISEINGNRDKCIDLYYLASSLVKMKAKEYADSQYRTMAQQQVGKLVPLIAMVKDASKGGVEEDFSSKNKFQLAHEFYQELENLRKPDSKLSESKLDILFQSFKEKIKSEKSETPVVLMNRCFSELKLFKNVKDRNMSDVDQKELANLIANNTLDLFMDVQTAYHAYTEAYKNDEIDIQIFRQELIADLNLLSTIQLMVNDGSLALNPDFKIQFDALKEQLKEEALKQPLLIDRCVDAVFMNYLSQLYGLEELNKKFKTELGSQTPLDIAELIQADEIKYLTLSLQSILQQSWAVSNQKNLVLENFHTIQGSIRVLWPNFTDLIDKLDDLQKENCSQEDCGKLSDAINSTPGDQSVPPLSIYHQLVHARLKQITEKENQVLDQLKQIIDNLGEFKIDSLSGLNTNYIKKTIKPLVEGLIIKTLSPSTSLEDRKKGEILLNHLFKADILSSDIPEKTECMDIVKKHLIDKINNNQSLRSDIFAQLVNFSHSSIYDYRKEGEDQSLQTVVRNLLTDYLKGNPTSSLEHVRGVLVELYNAKQTLDEVSIELQSEHKKGLEKAVKADLTPEDQRNISISFLHYNRPTQIGVSQAASFEIPDNWLDMICSKKGTLLPSQHKLGELITFAASENEKHSQRFYELKDFIEQLEVKFDDQLSHRFKANHGQFDFSLIHKMRDYQRYLEKHAEEMKVKNPEKAALLKELASVLQDKRQDFKKIIREDAELGSEYNKSKTQNFLAHGWKKYNL